MSIAKDEFQAEKIIDAWAETATIYDEKRFFDTRDEQEISANRLRLQFADYLSTDMSPIIGHELTNEILNDYFSDWLSERLYFNDIEEF